MRRSIIRIVRLWYTLSVINSVEIDRKKFTLRLRYSPGKKIKFIAVLDNLLKSTSEHCLPSYPWCITLYIHSELCEFNEYPKDFLFANRYGPIAHIKKVWNFWRPYWRRYWTCKRKMSFSRKPKTENNMQACFNILVLHRMLWCYLSQEANLCCSMLLIPKTRRILTEIEDFISESIWPFFDKKSKMS